MDLGEPKTTAAEQSEGRSRRTFIRLAGGVTAIGLAGCLGQGEGSIDELTIGYKPIFPYIQSLVMKHEGYYDELDATVKTENFGNTGLTIVQSFANDDLDVAFLGITPAIRMQDRGMPSAIVAANNKNGFVFLAREEFAEDWEDGNPQAAFDAHEERTGETFTFGTPPKSSVAYVLLNYWLEEKLSISSDSVDMQALGGAGPVRQALATGEVDGACIMEPIPTILERSDAPFEQIAWAGEFMSGQPGGVMVMHDRVRDSDIAGDVVEQHVRATEFVEENPDRTAEIVSDAVGPKMLPKEGARQALESPGANFISDPGEIEEDASVFCEWMAKLDRTDNRVDADDLFDTDVYANR